MDLYHVDESPQHICWDRKYYNTFEDNLLALKDSRTVYVGNLSFYTTEMQIEEIFSSVGAVKRVIMGLNMKTKTPCGFCFVEYYTTEHAAAALKFVSGTKCDDRVIRCDMDTGFKPGRQYGRGISGGQVRDERRADFDSNRGGLVPRTSGHKRSHDGKRSQEAEPNDRHKYSGANTDAFGRDVMETREEAVAASLQRLDSELSAGRGDGQRRPRDRDGMDDADEEVGRADAQETEDASLEVDEAAPASMEDVRDVEGERNPSKRSRR